MKNLIISLICIFVSTNLFASSDISTEIKDIPHYKFYPKTEPKLYEGEILDFYSVKTPYGEFSNFALFPLFMDGKFWPSSEHYYQAQKFLTEDLQELIRNAKTPFEAATIARGKEMPVRDDWDDIKDGIMEKVVREKFTFYPVLTELLLSTNNSKIYEHTKNDCYWADCLDRTGKNKLGIIIEKVREELKNPK